MTDRDPRKPLRPTRRSILKGTAVGAGAAFLSGVAPIHFVRNAWAQDYPALGNFPVEGSTVTYGFVPPLTGPYADEGADQLKAYQLAVKHLNEGGGMLETLKPSSLQGNGVLRSEERRVGKAWSSTGR